MRIEFSKALALNVEQAPRMNGQIRMLSTGDEKAID